jgi:hypothetical protein
MPLLLTMGSVTELEGQYKKAAESFTRELLTWPESNIGPQSLELATCLHQLGHAMAHDDEPITAMRRTTTAPHWA